MLGTLAGQRSDREVLWVHVARNRAEHAFAEETRRLLAQLPRAVSHVRYTQPGPDDHAGADFDAAGRLDRDHLTELGISPQATAYVCGPAGFMDAISGWLGELGVDSARVRTEAFGAMNQASDVRPHTPIRAPIRGHLVSFARSGVEVRFDGARWRSLLELAEECDVPASWSCRTGVCHRCESGVVAGAVSYDPEPLDLPAPGNALLCSARPIEDVTLDL
jgi:ferredoxin-NADP reductase